MDVETWLKEKGSYADGLALYKMLPGCNKILLSKLSAETPQNLLSLKYELRMALSKKQNVSLKPVKPVTKVTSPAPAKAPINEALVKKAAETAFEKETLAMYPAELHPVFRERVEKFYKACELKLRLNLLSPDEEEEALNIILELEVLWQRIDKCWEILTHWRQHRRLMPVEASKDFSKFTAVQLLSEKGNLKSKISKRQATISKLEKYVQENPEDRTKLNYLNKKREELQQLINDLEEVNRLIEKG